MSKQIAIIDCGTNTFHLLIAKIDSSKFSIESRIKRAVRLGAGGINQNKILSKAEDRALVTLKEFKDQIDKVEIETVYCFATSAFRNAINGNELKEKILSATRLDIQIISGEREAELIFKGVNAALNLQDETSLVMDIGGGSVEFIIGNRSGIYWKKSFEIGGQRLVEQFHKSDPIKVEEVEALENYLEQQLEELFDAINKYHPKVLAGSSGTFDTLSEIYCQQINHSYDTESPELPLAIKSYHDIHHELLHSSREKRLKIPGMIPMRVDMIVVASCLINFLLKKYSFERIKVSTYSLKEGFLAELLNQLQ